MISSAVLVDVKGRGSWFQVAIHRQYRLGAVQRLEPALLIGAEHYRAFGRVVIQADHAMTFSANNGSVDGLKES